MALHGHDRIEECFACQKPSYWFQIQWIQQTLFGPVLLCNHCAAHASNARIRVSTDTFLTRDQIKRWPHAPKP